MQRILDGDAIDVVARKAGASWATIANPYGVVTILLGVAVWVLAIRSWCRRAGDEFSTLGPVVHAVMATGVLGTVLNDAGVYVWLAATVTLGSRRWPGSGRRTEMVKDPESSTRRRILHDLRARYRGPRA